MGASDNTSNPDAAPQGDLRSPRSSGPGEPRRTVCLGADGRLVRRVKLVDRVSRWVITLGGMAIIGSVIAIYNFGFPEYNVPQPVALTLNLLDISLMLLIMTIGIKIFEFKDKDQKINIANKTIGVRKYGMFTLSIFVFDPLIGALVAVFFGFLFPGLINNILFGILIFLPVLMLVWWLIFHYWEKIDFKYTVEWLLGRIMEKLLPLSGVLSTVIRPLCAITICFTMASPKPVPPRSRLLPLSTR